MKKLLSILLVLLIAVPSVTKTINLPELLKRESSENSAGFSVSTKIAVGVGLTILSLYHLKAYCERKTIRSRELHSLDEQQHSLSNQYLTRQIGNVHALGNKTYMSNIYTGVAIGVAGAVATKVALIGLEKLYGMLKN